VRISGSHNDGFRTDSVRYLKGLEDFLRSLPTPAGIAPIGEVQQEHPEYLARRVYVLEQVDGMPFAAATTPVLAFAEDMRISGAVCNNFAGRAEIKDNVLTAKNLASTRKLCFDDSLNALESDFLRLLGTGMEMVLDKETLTLRQGDRTFIYRLSAG
jgi:heat shock protein HslJ